MTDGIVGQFACELIRRLVVPGGSAGCFLWLLALFSCSNSHADDWAQWRGLNRNAVSSETGLMKSWSDAPPVLGWRASGIGQGYASVVVCRGLVFTSGRIGSDVYCFAIDLKSGARKWVSQIGTTTRNVMATPSVGGEFVYVVDPDGELVCLNVSHGEIIWQRSFTEDFGGRLMSGRGYGESPLIDGDRLICTPGGADAMMVALDRRTGDIIWKSEIPNIGEKGSDGAAFSSIVISEAAGVRQYVQLVGRGLVGVDAKSGRFLWGYNDISNGTANIPTPIVRGDHVFCANGYHSGSVLLKIDRDESGTGVTADEVYRLKGNKFQNHHGGFVLIGNHVFGGHGSNNGLPTCIEFRTGTIVWKQRGPGTGSASVVAADGHLYFHYQDGAVALIEANSDEYRLKGTFKLPNAGGDSWSHPVIADGKLFLREHNELSAYDLRAVAAAEPRPELVTAAPEFVELIHLGADVEFVRQNSEEERHRIYQYAIHDDEDAIPVITLTNRHVDEAGALSESVVAALRQLKSMFVLNAAGTRVSVAGIGQAASMKQLIGISLAVCPQVDDAAIEPFKRAQSLRVLIAAGTDIGPVGLAHLAELPELAAIDLEVCDNVSDTSCDVLARMKNLKALVLKKTGFEPDRISGAGLRQLADLRGLQLLNLYGNAINDKATTQLQALESLRDLDLSLTAISDEGLQSLTFLQKLTELRLLYSEGFAGPKITNRGLKSISQLSQLRSLNLVGAKVSDNGIGSLTRLKELKHLTLIGTPISVDGLRRLRETLPDCTVASDRSSAGMP
ncbi:MAG: PQQ-binding-like beta-propeller repeat protein [Fuerstiella sp.]|nr:PQQ-binding-like beta-propeller repeat protein [Fuerstiella sp.]MCP4505681.1 PQQ-binding-like beta-propeller repeat protein [Fuerstiella sp.]